MQTSVAQIDLDEIGAMHARGVAENNAGRPARAARILRRSLAQLAFDSALDSRAGQVLAGRIWLSLALAETEWHGPEAGLAAMVQAQHFAASADDAALRVLVHAQLGAIQLRLGALQESLSELDQAVALLDDAAPVDRCNMLLSRGYVHLYLGNLNQSRSDLALAAELAHKSGLLLEDFKARHNLGYVEFLAGELPKSLQIMDEAAQLGADLPRGIPLLDRARVLVEAGLISEADETLVAAEQIFARDRLLQGLGEVELARAECALLAAEPGTARRLAVTARGRFRRRGNDRWRRSAELVLLQADVARGRSGRAVEDEGRRLAAELGAEGLSAQSRVAAFVTAEALLDRGCPDEARAVADTAGPAKRSDPIGARLHTGYLRARLARATGEPAKAAQHVRSSLNELATYQARFGSIDMQTGSAIHGRRLAELGVAIALDGGRAATVFAASERSRAVSSRLPAVRPPADERTAELLADLRHVVEGIRTAPGDDALRRRRRDLEREIKARSWVLAGAGQVYRPAGLATVRAAATSTGSTLVSFVRATGFTSRSGRRCARYLDAMRSARRREWTNWPNAPGPIWTYSRTHACRRACGRRPMPHSTARSQRSTTCSSCRCGCPRRDWSSCRRVSSACCHGAAMPSCRGVPVTVTPSATAWRNALTPSTARAATSVTAIAGPDLDRAEYEVATVAREWSAAKALTGTAAGRDALAGAMARATVVHVAAHGRHHTENPLFSSITLADGALFAYELDQTARCADHVILSACELGRATIRPGDEALGLTSVLLHLGTRSVVAGVARVDDETAADVMIRYHRRLAAGRDSAEALADALSVRAASPAPFVCFGSQWSAG